MIINKQTNEVLKTGEDTSKKATINQDKIAKLQYILTKGLYQDPIGSVINEWSANAIDSVVQSGKNPIENPVIINITNDKFTVQDSGLGISKDDFINVCMNYLTSTKETDNQAIGSFGLGMKSFLALDRSATFTTIKDGIECKFISYMGDEFMEYDLIYEKPTEKQNGFICELKINDWKELREFKEKAKKRLAYYDTVLLFIDDVLIQNEIIRSEDWQYSSNANTSYIHICLKDVFYQINWEQLGNLIPIQMPVALKFDLDSGLTPTPSRESLILNSTSKQLIIDKIKKVADWFVNKYNEDWKEYDSFIKAFNKINNETKEVIINNRHFFINDLLNYTKVIPKKLSIKNIRLQSPSYYIENKNEFLSEYETIALYNNANGILKKNISKSYLNYNKILTEYIVVIVNKMPSNNFKNYLVKKYKNNCIIFVKKILTREIGLDTNDWKLLRYVDYRQVLNLTIKPEETWQGLIDEWNLVEKEFKDKMIDESNTENSEEYLDWLKELKKNNKTNNQYYSNHKVLNKQNDEVTLAIGRSSIIGNKITFDKNTFKIKYLHKSSKLTIYFLQEEKEKAESYYRLLNPRIKIAIVGKNEQLKIKNIHNFMTEQEFQKSKVFKRIVTSIMFDELVQNYKNIFHKTSLEVIHNVIKPLEDDINLLEAYTSKNGKTIRDNELLDSMIAIAKEYNLYDYQFMDVYNRCKESLDKYKFLNYIQKPDRWNEENVKEVNSIITQFLYHQKMYKGLHQELEFVIKEQEKEIVEELQLEIV